MRFHFDFGIPFPVSDTSTHAFLLSWPMLTRIVPSPCRASSEFFIRFSITHSKRVALMFTLMFSLSSPSYSSVTLRGMRLRK